MKKVNLQVGFTLIELVMVIVIIGVLASIATPKIVDWISKANEVNVAESAGRIERAAVSNQVGYAVGASGAVAINDANACTTAAVNKLLAQPLVSSVTVAGALDCNASPTGTTGTCTLTSDSQTANFKMVCAK